VQQVINRIGVLPASAFDDDLRLEIARAIYGNPSFWQYNSMANPPIHIIVEAGRITLTGVVNNNVERMLARSLASGYQSFGVTDDLKTDAEMRAALERIR
jgi:hyperosmotically inducible protein